MRHGRKCSVPVAVFSLRSQPGIRARFVAVLHPGTRCAHALCWPLPPFSRPNSLPPRVGAAFCRETLRWRLCAARPVWASPPGVPREGAGPPGSRLGCHAAAGGGSGAGPRARLTAVGASNGVGDRARGFSRLNFLFLRWEPKERLPEATPSPGPLALSCGGSASFPVLRGCVDLVSASSVWRFKSTSAAFGLLSPHSSEEGRVDEERGLEPQG